MYALGIESVKPLVAAPDSFDEIDGLPSLVGQLDMCTIGLDRSYGICLVTKKRGVFTHPGLFTLQHAEACAATFYWVRIQLVGDMLEMRPCHHQTQEVVGDRCFRAPPVRVSHLNFEQLLDVAFQLFKQGARCLNPDCRGAGDRQLDPYRSVAVGGGIEQKPAIICATCYKAHLEKDPAFAERVLLDGRCLPTYIPLLSLVEIA